VSTGGQDESSQIRVIEEYAGQNGVTIVKTFKLHGYSASNGSQELAMREAIADMERGDYSQCHLAYFDHAAVLSFALVRTGLASLMVAGPSWRVPCWPGFLTV
jgi:hypothetical protein